MARHPVAPAEDPYRTLFHQLAAAVARCRLIVEANQVIAVDVLDHNAAFDSVRGHLPRLFPTLARVRERGAPETVRLATPTAQLAVTAVATGADEVTVVFEARTGRDEPERRARDAQARFDQVFHGNAAAMVIAHQRDLRIIDVNPRWLELFGAERADVIGRTSVELGLITASTARTRIAQHQQFTEGYDTELELVTCSGAPLTVLASARPIQIAEGTCTLTTLIDITGRKHAEEAFAVAFSASPAGMMLVDATSDAVVAVNRRLLEMTHDRREDLIGRRASELTMVRSPSRDILLAEIARSGRLDGVELELACETGPGIWTLASTEKVTLRDRVHRLSVFTDITGRKQLEDRLRTQHAIGHHLAESSELAVAIPRVLEALCRGERWDLGAVWLTGAEGEALACGGAWHAPGIAGDVAGALTELGLSPAALAARIHAASAAEKIAMPDAAPGAMRRAAVFPILRGHTALGVITLAARDGDAGLDAAERGLFDSIGRLLGLFIERARAQAALRELNIELERRVSERTRELETSNRDLEAFTASVSHDLRAPLRAIHGFAEILLDDHAAALPDEAKDLLTRIHGSGERMRALIEDLLAFSRLGRAELSRTEVDVDALVRSVIDELLVGRELGDRLDLRVLPLGTCDADPSLLRPVWTNLIDNALKYARDRDRIVIEIGRDRRGDETVYHVRDNGVGFDMAHAGRLFGVFQRLHKASEFEGTGIGLANVRRIIEHHHGRVAASSEPGRGSTFEFTLGTEPT